MFGIFITGFNDIRFDVLVVIFKTSNLQLKLVNYVNGRKRQEPYLVFFLSGITCQASCGMGWWGIDKYNQWPDSIKILKCSCLLLSIIFQWKIFIKLQYHVTGLSWPQIPFKLGMDILQLCFDFTLVHLDYSKDMTSIMFKTWKYFYVLEHQIQVWITQWR